ncbi:MAG: AAA family ATPase [Chloroflexota bacterium]|nr:AAA family ATPase [Chloroflexota bacterium]
MYDNLKGSYLINTNDRQSAMKFEPLEIHLLGPVEISYRGKPLKISRRLERVMLYYLAGEHRPISRSDLIDKLWPNANQADPRRALRTALSRLRKQLPDPEFIKTELDKVWLDIDRCNIDLLSFERLNQRLMNLLDAYHKNRSLPKQIARHLQEALSFWHGESFLLGEDLSTYPEIEFWRQTQNKIQVNYRRSLMKRLGEHYQAAGHPEMALGLFMQLVQGDLLYVNLHLAVLEILTQLGRHQEVVDYCDKLEADYEREYHNPLPEAILSHYQYSQIQVNLNKKIPAREWSIPLTMQLEMVGRQEELTQLQNAYFQGGVVVIKGKQGCGKSRLVQELYHNLTPTPLFLVAPSLKLENTLPLSPIIHCLRHQVPEEIWKEINPIWLDQMTLLLPELAEKQDTQHTGQFSSAPSGQQNLFEALLHVCSAITKKYGRILVFLDDAQWVDDQTIQALSYLVLNGFFKRNGLLIITADSEEPNPNLEKMIDRWNRSIPVKNIQVGQLTPDEIAALAQQVLDKPLPTSMVDRLFIETNGNPFFTLEIIRYLLDLPQDIESYKTTDPFPLPDSVHSIIRVRLGHLDVEARHILQCAAVLGSGFSTTPLQSIAQLEKIPDLSFLNPLINAGFILPSQENPASDNYHFVHEKMREVVLNEASPLHLQIIHRRVARYLVDEPQAKMKAGIIANHFLKGGKVKEAFHWFLIAAKNAWNVGAKEDVLKAYQVAENLYYNAPEGTFDIHDAAHLYQQWGEFAYQSTQIDMLEETGAKLQYLGEKEHIPKLIGASKIALANACLLRRSFDTGLKIIQEAISIIEHTDDRLTFIRAILREGSLHWLKFNFDQAMRAAEKALKIIETTADESADMTSLCFYARYIINMCYYANGEGEKALLYVQETYDNFYHQLNAFDRTRTHYLFSYIHLLMANFEECKRDSLKGYKIADSMGLEYTVEICLIHLSKANFYQGNLDDAYNFATKALMMSEKNNHKHLIAYANCALGDVFGFLNNFVLAAKYFKVAQLRLGFDSTSLPQLVTDLHLAHLFIWSEDLQEARTLLSPVLEITKKFGVKHLLTQALILSGTCDLIEGNFIPAEEKINQAAELAQNNGLKFESMWCKLQQAQLAVSQRKLTLAEGILREILVEDQTFSVAWLKLYGMGICAQIQDLTDQFIFPDLQSDFTSFLDEIESHTQSPPLIQEFTHAKRYWQEGVRFP